MLPSWEWALTACLVFMCAEVARALVGNAGDCSLMTFVDVTWNGTGDIRKETEFAFSHIAAVLLAVSDFNQRNPSVVPELVSNPSIQQCNFNFGEIIVEDTQHLVSRTVDKLYNYVKHANEPCGMIGSYSHFPIQDVSTFASAMKVPMVTHTSLGTELSISNMQKYISQSNALASQAMRPMIKHLRDDLGRENYYSILYSSNRREYLSLAKLLEHKLHNEGIQSHMQGYSSISYISKKISSGADDLYNATGRIKEIGYRTIIVIGDNTVLNQFTGWIDQLAIAANSHGMNQGEYFWAFWNDMTLSENGNFLNHLPKDDLRYKLLSGAVAFDFIEPFLLDGDDDKFLKHWKTQNDSMVEQLNAINPIADSKPGYYAPSDDYFQTITPAHGSAFLYDAVIAVGVGACTEAHILGRNGDVSNLTGAEHIQGLQKSVFSGASGHFQFDERIGANVRTFSSGIYAAYNLLPFGTQQGYRTNAILDPMVNSMTAATYKEPGSDNSTWITIDEFIFYGGLPMGSIPLIDPERMNYLPRAAQISGFTLYSIAVVGFASSMVWIVVHRNHPVLLAAQPITLLAMNVGAFLMVSTIPTMSFDETSGLTEADLSKICTANLWFYVVGIIFMYGAIFVKLARVNKVLQFRRQTVTFKQIAFPVYIIFTVAVALLIVYTILHGQQWDRDVINQRTGESYGKCSSKGPEGMIYTLICISFVPMVLAVAAAWKTKDVEDSFSESWWIFAATFVNTQLFLVLAPMAYILEDANTVGYYLCLVFMAWTTAVSTILMVMVPKVLAFHGLYGGEAVQKRGARSDQNPRSFEKGISRVQSRPGTHQSSPTPVPVRALAVDGGSRKRHRADRDSN